jgi:NRAMP (natural resistance-associated macrophage protein)-like metal ion transporter
MHNEGFTPARNDDSDKDSPAHEEPLLMPDTSPGTSNNLEQNRIKTFLKVLGPGLITGAADDDPSGIATYSIAGASLGFTTLWTALVTLPLMSVVQFLCAKIGMVSGMGLAAVLRKHYSRWLLYPAVFLLLIANTINAGTDIGAIGAAINLVVPIPISYLIVPIAVLIVALQFWGSYRLITRVFKWLTLTLFAYIGAAFLAKPHWREVLQATVIPTITFDKNYLTTIVAILGTTISPYLFFWQASQEVEEEISMGRNSVEERRGATFSELKDAILDTNVGMFVCNLVFYFVIVASAATLHAHGKTDIQSATDAARALEPLAGSAAKYLFAVGLIGVGFLAVPVLTGSAAYAVAETFGWECRLDDKPREAPHFYMVIAASTLLGMLINFSGINPMSALFWTAVINGLVSPPLLVVIMLVSNNKKVMGDKVNGLATNLVGWAAVVVMFAAAIGLVVTWVD